MKATKPLFKQLHESQELLKQKQSEIDELVEFISIASYVLSATKLKANELIQKHTKK